jgi:hypothetical protein
MSEPINEASLDPEALAAIEAHADASGLDWLRRDVRIIADALRHAWAAEARAVAHADAQVAAERGRLLAECDRYAAMNARNDDVRFGADRVIEAIRRIARGQP